MTFNFHLIFPIWTVSKKYKRKKFMFKKTMETIVDFNNDNGCLHKLPIFIIYNFNFLCAYTAA
jgi:hypothetical protein